MRPMRDNSELSIEADDWGVGILNILKAVDPSPSEFHGPIAFAASDDDGWNNNDTVTSAIVVAATKDFADETRQFRKKRGLDNRQIQWKKRGSVGAERIDEFLEIADRCLSGTLLTIVASQQDPAFFTPAALHMKERSSAALSSALHGRSKSVDLRLTHTHMVALSWAHHAGRGCGGILWYPDDDSRLFGVEDTDDLLVHAMLRYRPELDAVVMGSTPLQRRKTTRESMAAWDLCALVDIAAGSISSAVRGGQEIGWATSESVGLKKWAVRLRTSPQPGAELFRLGGEG